ncbi:hypothetical protein DITRI_Ditri15bG0083800 [Diplodiscus trichospermus]
MSVYYFQAQALVPHATSDGPAAVETRRPKRDNYFLAVPPSTVLTPIPTDEDVLLTALTLVQVLEHRHLRFFFLNLAKNGTSSLPQPLLPATLPLCLQEPSTANSDLLPPAKEPSHQRLLFLTSSPVLNFCWSRIYQIKSEKPTSGSILKASAVFLREGSSLLVGTACALFTTHIFYPSITVEDEDIIEQSEKRFGEQLEDLVNLVVEVLPEPPTQKKVEEGSNEDKDKTTEGKNMDEDERGTANDKQIDDNQTEQAEDGEQMEVS